MNKLTRNAQLRLQFGMALLGLAALIEIVLLTAIDGNGCRPGEHDSAWALAPPTIIGCWLVALLLLVWGRQRIVFGLYRVGALLAVAFAFPPAVIQLVADCLD